MQEQKNTQATKKKELFDLASESGRLKYEIACELGIDEKVRKSGWKSLTAKESGRLGGIMARRMKNSKSYIEKEQTE